MKTNPEIIKAVEEAKVIVQTIYKYDEKILKPKNNKVTPGVIKETEIVFAEVLRYLLNN